MSRFRLQPTATQVAALLEHCAHARFVWNLAVEQHANWRPDRKRPPTFAQQRRQLTDARQGFAWLAAGSVIVQQQALRDFHQALANYFRGTHNRPSWRKRGRHEGFRIVAVKPSDVSRRSRGIGAVKVPKVGWVRFRWSRPPPRATSYRITRDRSGRWHVAFAAVPEPILPPGNGEVVGVDRGVTVSAALSTGDLLTAPRPSQTETKRLRRLERKLARASRCSNRRKSIRSAIAKLKARETDRRKDWVEKTSTDLARRFDIIAVEDLDVRSMTRSARGTLDAPDTYVRQKAGLNRAILAAGWGRLVQRLEHKAPGRVVRVNPAYTSQRCSVCRALDAQARESQAAYACRSCGFTGNADINAARNIRHAAGHAVSARGGMPMGAPVNREPQPALLSDQETG